ncbi:nucleotidyltransferase family protein [Variovorax ginsengisoli]|uniref:Nucleotidyltransferase n=1 Tax=Variovorax ginsengisoli TaxID=363844 RepID=A0ABT9S7B7_9BURK|nr:nucleotidyltransferase family protein [Variovorax ginsengisoli]MDP9900236.1 putative nucleotidyltransferase [Variovorax ginsengisoli]
MKPSDLLVQHRSAIRQIALRHGMRSVSVFGSVLKGLDSEGSDLDLLVEPTPTTSTFDIGGVQFEVSELLGIPVDVLTPDALPMAFRSRVMAEAVRL